MYSLAHARRGNAEAEEAGVRLRNSSPSVEVEDSPERLPARRIASSRRPADRHNGLHLGIEQAFAQDPLAHIGPTEQHDFRQSLDDGAGQEAGGVGSREQNSSGADQERDLRAGESDRVASAIGEPGDDAVVGLAGGVGEDAVHELREDDPVHGVSVSGLEDDGVDAEGGECSGMPGPS